MTVGFLDLPRDIRRRIYLGVGIVDNASKPGGSYTASICLNPDPPGGKGSRRWADYPILARTMALLLTCRLVYVEVAELVYSSNRFVVHYRKPGDLKHLRTLSQYSVAALTQLDISLNIVSCFWGHGRCPRGADKWSFPGWDELYELPLDSTSPQGQTALDEWRATARSVAPHIRPGALDLSFVCDVEDYSAAEAAVRSLHQFPRLRGCRIRLGRRPDRQLQLLARDTVLRMTGQDPKSRSATPFRFMDLPLEIRFMILKYTDLVTPLKEVSWNPDQGFFLLFCYKSCATPSKLESPACPREPYGTNDRQPRPPVHHSCRFRSCFTYYRKLCFCHRFHSAYSQSEPKCDCWIPPKSFFLVSRDFLACAREIFFTRNRFIIFPSNDKCLRAGPMPKRYPAAVFLNSCIPRSCLQLITSLEIVFQPFDEYSPQLDPAYHDWVNTIEIAKDKLDLSRLVLRVYMGDQDRVCGVTEVRRNFSVEQGRALQSAQVDILRPLRAWGQHGLKGLFIHLPWPWRLCDFDPLPGIDHETLRAETKDGTVFPRVLDVGNENAERMIMGACYDSRRLGKYDNQVSQWLLYCYAGLRSY